MRCVVCFHEEALPMELDAGSFSTDIALCKFCIKTLTQEDNFLVMCVVCGGFGITSSQRIAFLSGTCPIIEKGKINIILLKACSYCGGDIDNVIGHA